MTSKGIYLQWEGKRPYKQRIPSPRLLEPVNSLSTNLNSENLVIEGNNLQVLASLRGRYAGAVDVIYIDPPYNRGGNDFRYSDKRYQDPDADGSDGIYVTNEDGGKHTKWLNTMAPVMKLLWEMLHPENGVFFASINDRELFHLGLLLDEVFDEKNRIGVLVWKGATDNNPTRIAVEHEYILCYARNADKLARRWRDQDNEAKAFMLDGYRNLKSENRSLAMLKKAYAAFAKEHRQYIGDLYRYRHLDEHGPFVSRRNLDKPDQHGYRYKVQHPVTKKYCPVPPGGWRYPEYRFKELQEQGRIIFGKDEKKLPQLKVYLEEVEFPLRSVILGIDSRAGANELLKLTGDRYELRYPKPVELIKKLLAYTTRRDSLVLDAFAGSGTTAQAVMELNHRDKGSRRFILIEEGEPDDRYCRTLTAKRVRAAIDEYGFSDGFTFFTTGRKLDRKAIIGFERDALANLICQSDETGRGRGITRLSSFKFIIGKNSRNEAICLLWNGSGKSEVTKDHLRAAADEVSAAQLKRPFRIYGTSCRYSNTTSWRFCQIPDEILLQLQLDEEPSEIDDE